MIDKIKEIWSENKTPITHCSIFLIGFVLATAIVFSICDRRIDRADSENAALRAELQSARKEVERAGDTISEIRRLQFELTDGLGDSNTEFHTVIERLTLIRDKVKDIEDRIDDYEHNSRSYHNIYDN